MTEPREPSRFLMPPVNAAANRMNTSAGMPAGYAGAAAFGPMSESLLSVAWRSRWPILLCVILATAGGFTYVQTATPIYTSTSRLYLDYMNIIPPGSEPGRQPQTERYLHTQAGQLRSRPIVASAVQALESQRLQTFRDVDVPVAFVDKNLLVEVGRKDDIVSISFNSPYPIEAAQIVNGIVEAYMTSRSEREQRNATQVLKILQEDLGRIRTDLVQKRAELEGFQNNQMPLSLGSESGGGVMQRYLSLQAELAAAQTATLQARTFRDAVRILALNPGALRQYVRLKGNPSSYISEAETSPLEIRLSELSLEIEELSEKLTADHPTVVTLMNQRSALEARLTELDNRLVSAVLAAAEQSSAEAMDYEKQLGLLFDEQKQQMASLNAEVTGYQRLRSEVDQLEEYRGGLEQQVREIARIVDEDVGQLRMAILEPALPAEDPSEPQKARVMAMALVLGLLLGGGVAVAKDWLDQTLRSADEISAMLGVPALGVIPAMSRHQKAIVRGQKVFRHPDSHEAEAFRTVRTAIFFGAPNEHAKTLLVTSPGTGEGKSTLVSNLGIAMAVAGQRTIILDADLRKPMQHEIFEVDSHGRSLESVLRGTVRLGEAIRSTEIKGLSLLPCRGDSPNPAETLNSPRFNRLIDALKKNYDRVLIDAPPVNVVTDAQILAATSDFTVLVLKADRTTRKMTQRAVEALRSVGAQILGVVVNQVSKSDDRYGYYGGYKRAYGSGSNGEKDRAKWAQADRAVRSPVTDITPQANV